jgi:hypothetical protein
MTLVSSLIQTQRVKFVGGEVAGDDVLVTVYKVSTSRPSINFHLLLAF